MKKILKRFKSEFKHNVYHDRRMIDEITAIEIAQNRDGIVFSRKEMQRVLSGLR